MYQLHNTIMRHVNRLDTWEWFALMLCVLMVGFVCMKGFGSRSNY